MQLQASPSAPKLRSIAQCEKDADGSKIQQYIDKFKLDYRQVVAQRLDSIVSPEAAAYYMFTGLPY